MLSTKLGRKGQFSSLGSGFTQVELLVVIGIIALLAAILLPSVGDAGRGDKPARADRELRSADSTAGAGGLTCGSPNAGSCFQAHVNPFCDNANCCGLICGQVPQAQCCTAAWSPGCVSLAQQLCAPTGACCARGCFVTDRASCVAAGGPYLGDGTDCTDLTICQPDEPCEHCGGFPHWGHQCPAGIDHMPTGLVAAISVNPDSCNPDANLVLDGPVIVRRTVAMEDSLNFPGFSTMPNHLDVIDTEMVSMELSGNGVVLRAGTGMGVGAPLRPTLGAIVERAGNVVPADSFFDVFFEIELPGGEFAYNQSAVRVYSEITCLPPNSTYYHLITCEKLFTSPFPGQGIHLANLVTANHSTYPTCGSPGTGPCGVPHDSPYCSNEPCCRQVCESIPECCTGKWNEGCVSLAQKICEPVGACCAQGSCKEGGACFSGFDTCDGRLNCYCFESAEGGPVCASDFPCAGVPCPNGTTDCPAGEVCIVNTCCGQPQCAPSACGNAAVAVDPSGGETATGQSAEVAGVVFGQCAVVEKTLCENNGGVFQGDGTTCYSELCALREACCIPDGLCRVMDPIECRAIGGNPQGTPSSCQGDGNGDGIDDACAAPPCAECGPGQHWIHNPPCPPGGFGSDTLPSGAVAGIDFTGDCIADTNLVMSGPATIHKRGPRDASANFPGLRPIDDHLDVVDTELVAMSLTGGGVVLTAGGGLGAIPLRASLGAVAEQLNNPSLADSFFDVFFEVDTPQGRLYNLLPIRVETTVTCLPPDGLYAHIGGCTPLSTSPHPGEGQIVAYLTSAKHFTYPGCCLPDGRCIDASGPACEELNGKPVPECLGDANTNNIDDACEPKCAPTPDQSACESSPCPNPLAQDRCVPRCVNHNPFTGQTKVIDCECTNVNECHVQLSPQHDGAAGVGSGCIVPDNGSGTVTLPPANCGYVSPDEVHMIIDGLPAGTTIQIGVEHREFFCPVNPPPPVCSFVPPNPGVDCDLPGGSLGGEKECSNSFLAMNMHGTGALGAFNRQVGIPVSFETHVGPRTPGNPVQSFDTDMFRLFGQITNPGSGDPDFDLLRIVAGTDFGLPSPGHTMLTRIGGDWAVDSFFDITYRIDFVGKSGGALSGMSGSTTGTIRMQTGAPLRCEGGCPAGVICEENRIVNADGTIDICCRCTPTVVEVDQFPDTSAQMELQYPNGATELIDLHGPTTVHVFFEGDSEGDANDSDGDGLDDVDTRMVDMHLAGTSLVLGPVEVRLHPTKPTLGQIEEQVNFTPGTLDLPPFTPAGQAASFFDVFFEVHVANVVLHTQTPKRMSSVIRHKPPAPGDTYENPQKIELLDANGNPTGFSIGAGRHTPRPELPCCLPQGQCALLLPERCREANGVPLGPNAQCQGDGNGNQINDACEPAKEPCGECGPGPHWMHNPPCPPGADIMSTGAVIGLSINGDCVEDGNLVLSGAASVLRSGPRDASANYPGLRPVDGHLDVIDTEIVSMSLTGSGVTLIAGAGLGQLGLPASLGVIVEQGGNSALADSFFDVFFEVREDGGGGTPLYNQSPVRVYSEVDCLPPDATYFHLIECLPLYSSPIPGQGVLVAYLTSANHSTFPKCGDPGTGSCDVPHDPPFCDREECCERVCAQIPECCQLRWAPICAGLAQEICVQPTVTKWESVVTHTGPPPPNGPVGPVALEIPDDGSFSEPRNAIRKIVVTFDRPIDVATVTPDSVNICGLKPAGTQPETYVPVDLSGVTITVKTTDGDTKLEINIVPGLPDFARYLITLKGIHGPFGPLKPGTGGLSRIITALRGDARMDLRVNVTDLSLARGLVGTTDPIDPAILNEVRSDANNDGRVNVADLSVIRARVGSDARFIPNPVCP